MSILDLLLDRIRSLTQRRSASMTLSPELQAQINAIPDMVRDEDGSEGFPLRKDLNPDRVTPTCPGCYYYSSGVGLKCAVNPMGNADTCEHFKPI